MPRRQRFDHGRNLQNLRVIPTSKSSPVVNKTSPSPTHTIYTFIENRVLPPPPAPPVVPMPLPHFEMMAPGFVPIGPRPNPPFPCAPMVNRMMHPFQRPQMPPPFPPAAYNKPPKFGKRQRTRMNRRLKRMQESLYKRYDSHTATQVEPVTENFEKVGSASKHGKVGGNASKAKVGNASETKVKNTSETKVQNASETKVKNESETKVKNLLETKVKNASKVIAENAPKTKVESNASKAKVENSASKAIVENELEAKVEHASKAKAENAPKTKVENASKAKAENASKTKVENASKAKVGNALKAKVENASKAKDKNASESKVEMLAEENYFEEVEVASVEGEEKREVLVGYRKTKQRYLGYKKKRGYFRPKIFVLGERTFVNCLNMHDDVDVDVVSEAEYEYENEEGEKVDALNKVKAPHIILRKYKTCIESSNELTQEECLIQSSLDTWKSHLLGLEYLIEIQNEERDAATQYQCSLCESEVSFRGLPAIYVMNHVSDRKHVVRYLEKHFSAYGFKLVESRSYHTESLKKIAEEVNYTSGYYFMCVTTLLHYAKSKQDFKQRIESAYHPNEKDVRLDETLVEKALNFNAEEIQNILSDIIGKVESAEKDSVEVVAMDVDTSDIHFKNTTSLEDSDGVKACDNKNKSGSFPLKRKKNKLSASKSLLVGKDKFSVSFPKGKSKSAFSSYLKSKYAKVAMHRKPLKRFSSHFNKECSQNEHSETEDLQTVEDSTTEQSVERTSYPDAVQAKEASQASVEESTRTGVDSQEAEVNWVDCNSSQHECKNREKVPIKATTVHSKHCRKTLSVGLMSAAVFMQCVY